MKRVGDLWPRVVDWGNLLEAAERAARGKRSRPDVARFQAALEPNLCALQRELAGGRYSPGPYRTFWIHDPKPRMISAAPFRDRVVHHALTNVLEPVFEPRFTAASFASRKGFGQHRALALAHQAVSRYPYVLKADIRKYFPSLDHAILKGQLERVVKCRRTLGLAAAVIDGSNAQEEPPLAWFAGDNLLTPLEQRRGLPIGNQTSQFFSNVYLNPLDQFVLRELRPGVYLRYVDDLVLFGREAAELERMLRRLTEFAGELRLLLHERKSVVLECGRGLRFLGWRLFPGYARLPRQHVVRTRRRFRAIAWRFNGGELDFEGVEARVQAWLGHAAFGASVALREAILGACILVPAAHGRNCVARRVLEQQSRERARLEP